MQLKIYPFLLLTLLGMAGCNKDFLVRDNPTATTDEKWWNLESDLNTALGDLYNGLPCGTLGDYGFWTNARMHTSGATDESVFRANFGDWQDYGAGTATVQQGSAQEIYQRKFLYIRNACRFLEHYKKAYVANLEKKERFASEARALRAWYHLELFQLYGPIPIVSKTIDVNEQFVKRNTAAEVIKFIADELELAAAGLPDKYSQGDQFRITKGACYAIQASLYINAGDYANAAIAAKKVIDLQVYTLHHSSDPAANNYAQLFSYNGVGSNEVILFRGQGQRGGFFRSAPKSLNGQSCNSPTAAMVNAYETLQGKTIQELGKDSMAIYAADPVYKNNRDPRLKASIAIPGETFIGMKLEPWKEDGPDAIGKGQSTHTGFWIKKYVDPLDQGNTDGGGMNFIIIRYAEILLDYVESLIETDRWQNADVVHYLNEIRARAGMPDVNTAVYNSKEKLRELVRRERLVELSFEGQRLFDIRRWKIAEKVMNGPAEGAVSPITGKPIVVEVRRFNPERDYLWPIPLLEMTSNPNMVQNPGW